MKPNIKENKLTLFKNIERIVYATYDNCHTDYYQKHILQVPFSYVHFVEILLFIYR